MAYLKDKIITREMRHKRKTDEDLLDYANRKRRMGRFNDVDIKVENVIFSVNKMILSSNSEYFERMFESEMQESYQNEVTIKSVTSSSMKSLVEYFYTNQIDINKDDVFELLSASNMLQIDDVSGACLKFLQVSINFDTVFTILSLADLYLSKELQDGAKFFIL
ncbi:kelch repeat and BTB domain-containing protein 2-like isoform X2 [Clavelina lepadiformis]|uniref:kelch repeat and BTB domain-containing protein 2-like isoform X2 n=1 Tax=Clavelina lepadiformis TaxID=159417 RepID=UPI00404301BE